MAPDAKPNHVGICATTRRSTSGSSPEGGDRSSPEGCRRNVSSPVWSIGDMASTVSSKRNAELRSAMSKKRRISASIATICVKLPRNSHERPIEKHGFPRVKRTVEQLSAEESRQLCMSLRKNLVRAHQSLSLQKRLHHRRICVKRPTKRHREAGCRAPSPPPRRRAFPRLFPLA